MTVVPSLGTGLASKAQQLLGSAFPVSAKTPVVIQRVIAAIGSPLFAYLFAKHWNSTVSRFFAKIGREAGRNISYLTPMMPPVLSLAIGILMKKRLVDEKAQKVVNCFLVIGGIQFLATASFSTLLFVAEARQRGRIQAIRQLAEEMEAMANAMKQAKRLQEEYAAYQRALQPPLHARFVTFIFGIVQRTKGPDLPPLKIT